jgi:hypothetical protein
MEYMFGACYSLISIPMLDMRNVSIVDYMLYLCYSLTYAYLKNVDKDPKLDNSSLLSKASLLYFINNEAVKTTRTFTLASYAYNKWANDPDIVAALANHPNISLASA